MKKKTKQTLAMLSVAAIAGTMLGACKKHTDNAVTLTVWCSQMDMDLAKEISEKIMRIRSIISALRRRAKTKWLRKF